MIEFHHWLVPLTCPVVDKVLVGMVAVAVELVVVVVMVVIGVVLVVSAAVETVRIVDMVMEHRSSSVLMKMTGVAVIVSKGYCYPYR